MASAPCIASWNRRRWQPLPNVPMTAATNWPYGQPSADTTFSTIANGDPGLPFVTLIDVTDLVNPNLYAALHNPWTGALFAC